MKTVRIFEVGEEVYVKAKVAAIVPDKDRFTYELTEPGGTDKFKHRFQEKDLTPIEEVVEPQVKKKGTSK